MDRAVAQAAAERCKGASNGERYRWWRTTHDRIVRILTPDHHCLEEFWPTLWGEQTIVGHAKEGGNDLADPGRWPRLTQQGTYLATNATKRMRHPFGNHDLLTRSHLTLLAADPKDKAALDNLERFIVGGVKMFWRTHVAGWEDTHTSCVGSVGLVGGNKAKDPLTGDRL